MVRRGRRFGGYGGGGDEADADGWARGHEMVLSIPGVPGDSELEGHSQWISMLAWSWGMSRGDHERKKPIRIRNAIAAKKKALVKQAVKAFKETRSKSQTTQTAAAAAAKNKGKHSAATAATAAIAATTGTPVVTGTAAANGNATNGIGVGIEKSQTEKKENDSQALTPNKDANGSLIDEHGAAAPAPVEAAAAAAAAADNNTNGDANHDGDADGDGDGDGNGDGDGDEDALVNEQEIADAVLAEYDSDNDDDNQFDDSEVRQRGRSKPHMQNMSLTKYIDIASPLLMLKCLSKEPAFDCTVRICRRRQVKKPTTDTDADADADTKTDANGASNSLKKKTKNDSNNGADSDEKSADTDDSKAAEAEEKKEFEAVVIEEFLLQDCFVSSVSTGGSGGEDRLTENVTINFSRVLFTYTDHLGAAPRGARGEVPTKTIYYDSLRHKALALDQAVANAIEDQRKLAPVSTVLLDYLNLRSKPNTTTR